MNQNRKFIFIDPFEDGSHHYEIIHNFTVLDLTETTNKNG